MDKTQENKLYGRIRKLEKEITQLKTLINEKQNRLTPTYEKQPDGTYLLKYIINVPSFPSISMNQPFLSIPKL